MSNYLINWGTVSVHAHAHKQGVEIKFSSTLPMWTLNPSPAGKFQTENNSDETAFPFDLYTVQGAFSEEVKINSDFLVNTHIEEALELDRRRSRLSFPELRTFS